MPRLVRFVRYAVVLIGTTTIRLAAFGQGAGQTDHPISVNPTYVAPTNLDETYAALRAKDYDRAIAGFKRAIILEPNRPSIRKDLAYTLLKVGENEAARDQFGEVMRLEPPAENNSESIALEYAFLCYETKQPVTARRIFDRYRKTNATAAEAFENIDRPLREGIARWREALATVPQNFSGHEELARLAEQRDEIALAAEHYEKAWRLKPARRDLLVNLGRIWNQMDRKEEALSALLAASRGAEPRIAEQARELLPPRYPYVYEFEKALALDPTNEGLRRELAYLQLEMNRRADAEKQFDILVQQVPNDLLSVAQLGLLRLARGDTDAAMPLLKRVLAGSDATLAERVRTALRLLQGLQERPEEARAQVLTPGEAPSQQTVSAKELANRSLEKGYLKDAVKYLTIAHENDPEDFDIVMKLGWTYNILKNDPDALKWFSLARSSPNLTTAAEARKAYRNLASALERFRTTIWVFPTFSTRWHDLFAYAQAKTELRLSSAWPVRPYISVRFVGDTSGAVRPGAGFTPQYLSENAAIVALGMTTIPWRGLTGWFEAGEQMRYRSTPGEGGRMLPDFRGGGSYAKGFGHLLSPDGHGRFAETNDDAVYVSRFDKDTLFYSQNRAGYTFRPAEGAGGLHTQFYWNANVTTDLKHQYWANYVETGPGLRFRLERLPAVLFSVNLMRGSYLVNTGNPRGPNFNDLRIGVWYAITR